MNAWLPIGLENKNQPHHLVAATMLMLSVVFAHRVPQCHGFRAAGFGCWCWQHPAHQHLAFHYRRQPMTMTTTTRAFRRVRSSTMPMQTAHTVARGVRGTSTTARLFSRLECGASENCCFSSSTRTPSLQRFGSSQKRKRGKALHSATTTTTQATVYETTSNEITDETLYQQFKDLSIEIRMHDELYYTCTEGKPGDATDGESRPAVVMISDDEFDALVRREEELETKHPEFLRAWRIESGLGEAATRSGRVGTSMMMVGASNTNVRLKRTLLSPMLSLDNVLNEEQLHGWLKRVVKATNELETEIELEIETEAEAETSEKERSTASSISKISIVTEPKLDGVSLSLRYESRATTGSSTGDNDGSDDDPTVVLELQWASTRGDGKVGQDVTAAANQMLGIPSRIHLPASCLSNSLSRKSVAGEGIVAVEVRGEVVLPRSEFLCMRQVEAEAAARQELVLEQTEVDSNSTETETENVTNSNVRTANHSPKSTKQKTTSFSNPRNAASGILLRKESNDPDEDSQARELRSLLRFYAYDVSGLEQLEADTNNESPEIDGTRIRQQLADWGFPLALPVTVTDIHWDRKDMIKTIDATSKEEEEEELESTVTMDDWFQEVIISEQVQPIMDYFSALEKHRRRLQQEDENLLSSSTQISSVSKTPKAKESKRTKNSPTEVYEWGDFDVDGCVHKVSQASIKSAMGYSMKSPKWATAHKFPAQSGISRLLDIIVQVGRTGALTPVAILEPTEIGGVTVQRATLHNFGHLQEILGGGLDGGDDDIDGKRSVVSRIPKFEPVLLQRAGDVIPQVVRRISSHAESSNTASSDEADSSEWISLEPPERCPFCSSPVSYEASESSVSSVGQVIRCSGPPLLCPPRAVTSLKHAFSRDALDLTGLSEARIQQLMDADLLRYPSDIFRMGDTEWQNIAVLPGWGEKSCNNLREISGKIASNGIALSRFIYSLGIRHVGKHTSELVAESYGSIDAFLEALEVAASHQESPVIANDEGNDSGREPDGTNSTIEQPCQPFPRLENKLGIGPVIIESLLAFARTEELTNATKDLANSLTIIEQEVVVDEGNEFAGTDAEDPSVKSSSSSSSNSSSNRPWKGFRVVFTGSLGDGLTRSKAQDIAKQLGAKATPSSVSKSTDLVVYGEKGGKKLTQAIELGIPTVEADEFVRLAKEKGHLEVKDGL